MNYNKLIKLFCRASINHDGLNGRTLADSIRTGYYETDENS
jgi:hypothetical protein